MKKSIRMKLMATLLASTLAIGALASCGSSKPETDASTEVETTEAAQEDAEASEDGSEETTEVAAKTDQDALVVGISTLSQKFSPFYAETAFDREIADLTQLALFTNDREGNLLLNASKGVDVPYNGKDYHYQSAADMTIDKGENNTVYTIKIRDDIKFSDGVPVTIDDLIFSYYSYLDPSYQGSTPLSSLDIVGLRDYRTQTNSDVYDKYAGYWDALMEKPADYVWADGDGWTEEIANDFKASIDAAWTESATAIKDYVVSKYVSRSEGAIGFTPDEVTADEKLQPAFAMAMWGFAEGDAEKKVLKVSEALSFDLTKEPPTLEDMVKVMKDKYENDFKAFAGVELDGTNASLDKFKETFISTYGSKDEALGDAGVPNIAGIKRIDDYTMSITLEGFNAAAQNTLGIQISPLHYYGDKDKYDYANNKFGFDFGDQGKIRELMAKPMGAGPYKFIKYENRVVYFEANDDYLFGAPNIKHLQYKETNESDMVKGIVSASVDISKPSFNDTTISEIKSENSNGELTGDKLYTQAVDTLGYGYIGINADAVKVGEDPGSEQSKALRKALATILASFRELAVESYYHERAIVINYPISNTSWAAPRPADAGYQIAYSTDVDGNQIYTADMNSADRPAVALKVAIEYFKQAGYTFDEASGKFTAAPEGAKLDYEVIVPGQGKGDHPSHRLVSDASNLLKTIGINLKINDPADANVLWNSLNAGNQELWCAAWSAAIDPDMYQIYHSSNIVGLPGATGSNHYHIQSPELDKLIVDARLSADKDYRKAEYKAALDEILDWAVEIPVYQRQDAFVFSSERIDVDTITKDATPFYGWLNDITTMVLK